jgi:ribose transport system permease protein
MKKSLAPLLSRLLADHGMLLVLVGLCAYFSFVTIAEQHPEGALGGELLARNVAQQARPTFRVLIVVRDTQEDIEFANALARHLADAGLHVVEAVRGQPADARQALERIARRGERIDVIAANEATGAWPVLQDLDRRFPALGNVSVLIPRSYRWPNFLKGSNLLNITNQIAVIAIIAIGMTVVIITSGIDLSVGSLMALSAVVATRLIREVGGAQNASSAAMVFSCLAAISLCGSVGLLSGALVTLFAMPPFIATLGIMLVANGLAYILASGQSIYEVPDHFIWLGRGAELGKIPNAVVLMAALYLVAHLVMTRTVLGRHIYAVGGNPAAAWLSGVPVKRVLLLVYVLSGVLAGLGGVVMASQLKSGSPTYGQMYELYVIAAVVVGGTSLSGGEGRIFGTLIGALLIAVIQNGMNLTGVESYTQRVVLGLVILGAVLLDKLKKRGWRRLSAANTI